jgi:5'-3' exonuclease
MRVRHGIRAPDTEQQIGMAFHIIFNSIKKVWTDFNGSHTVFCMEGRSWRKDFYQPYKANRKIAAAQRTAREVEDDAVFFENMDSFVSFIREKTNCTVLRHANAEADDMIARWIALHPDDKHIIISSDSDFQQLIAHNVIVYNGIASLLYTDKGIYDKDGNLAKNKQGHDLPVPDPEWLLFEKCMRGDDSDNIMSAYPGVRKTKLQAAFEDRHNKGYAWNNLMLSKWTDHENVEHRVRDDYERNRQLIDLTQQPADLVDKFDRTIMEEVNQEPKKQIGINLMRFCNMHGLVRIEKNAADFANTLSAIYNGQLRTQDA